MKKTLLSGVMALGLLFTGCSAEEPLVPDVNKPLERDQTFYINMSINGDAVSGGRSSSENGSPVAEGDFDAGEGNESAVNNAYFVFYDEHGHVVGNIVPVDINHMTEVTNPVGSTVEKSYQSVVAVDVKKGEATPTQVICYINPISPSTLGVDLNVIQTVARTAVTTTVGNNTYMAMSNSVYYPDKTATAEPHIAVPIPPEARHTSEASAKTALEQWQKNPNGVDESNDPLVNKVVNIYVERYATKLKFSAVDPTDYQTCTRVFDVDADNSTKTTTYDVVLKFNPRYWAVNAEAKTSYVIKSFRREALGGGALPDNYTYGNLNGRINPKYLGDPATGLDYSENPATLESDLSWEWNNANYHRSYWGMSPAYFQKEYPEVSSDLKNIPDINQKYISFTELKNGYGFDVNTEEGQKAHYFKETTIGRQALQANNPNAALASVIYVGDYTVEVAGEVIKINGENPGFYTYMSGPVTIKGETEAQNKTEERPYIYFDHKDKSAESIVTKGESMLMRFLAQQTIIYKKVYNSETKQEEYVRYNYRNAEDRAKLVEVLDVSEVSDDVKEKYNPNSTTPLKLQNNTRTLQFKDKANFNNVFILTANGYESIVSDKNAGGEGIINIVDANVILMRQVGYAYYYLKGEGYFSIPVKHLGWYRQGNILNQPGIEIDWNLVRVGDFGMVRNHSYDINVTEILGLATGIGDEDNPIVPPSNSRKYYIAYSVNILKWAVVPKQDVKL